MEEKDRQKTIKKMLTVFRTASLVGLAVFALVLLLGIVLICTGNVLGGIICCINGTLGSLAFGVAARSIWRDKKDDKPVERIRKVPAKEPKTTERDYPVTTPEERRGQMSKKAIVSIVWMCVCIVLIVIPGIMAVEICTRERGDALTVTAHVTKHTCKADDDGDVRYASYVTYTVNGKEYKDVRFESSNRQYKLTGVGAAVNIEVSPKIPGILMSNLLEYGMVLVIVGAVLLSVTFSRGCTMWIRSRCTVGLDGIPDEDTIIQDAREIIWSKPCRYFLIPPLAITLLCLTRYGEWISSGIVVLAVLMGALLALFLFRAFRLCSLLKNREWELRADELIEKTKNRSYDRERSRRSRSSTYYLKFKSKDETWGTYTTADKFCAAYTGTYRWAVHLKGSKTPVLYYDVNGDATKV